MGIRACPRLAPPILILCLFAALSRPVSSQCRILKCNSEFVSASSGPSSPGGPGGPVGPEGPGVPAERARLCAALRAYAQCTRQTAAACRGDLAFHSAVHGISDLMAQHGCARDGPTPGSRVRGPQVQRPEHGVEQRVPAPCGLSLHYHQQQHQYQHQQQEGQQGPVASTGDRRGGGSLGPREDGTGARGTVHCAVFGDPHVRTFRDETHTCRARGAWPLVDTRALVVQATHAPAGPGSSATVLSKITVIFRSLKDCAEQKEYQAEAGSLPAAFVDGSRSVPSRERGGGGESLRVVEREAGAHVEIQARYLATTVVIRRVGRALGFAIRMPEALLLQPHGVGGAGGRGGAAAAGADDGPGLQLCQDGCPRAERIVADVDEGAFPPGPSAEGPVAALPSSLGRAEAEAECERVLPVRDFYFHACVFDLVSTGDVNFTRAAAGALEDAQAMLQTSERAHVLRRNSERRSAESEGLGPSPGNGAGPGVHVGRRPLAALLLLMLCLVV
ncbi:repulsive guidance molecule A-like [Petromyzon marinus]|uniref:Repulsive guidance molecule A-like n=1 Tax=Petromyzon marinus TaxID=7757 RepID=A0AAJ7SYE3_PETMA|nr:repulsive guidance molecule A-like [Petromyzon marinus]